VVRIINKLNLNNPKHLFVISYKVAFRLSMERVSGCVKITRILFFWNSYIVGVGEESLFCIRTRFDSKRGRVVVIFTYINLYICVRWLVQIFFRREKEECFIALSRKVPGIFFGHSHVRALPTQDVAHYTY